MSSPRETIAGLHAKLEGERRIYTGLARQNPMVRRLVERESTVETESSRLEALALSGHEEAQPLFFSMQELYAAFGRPYYTSFEELKKALKEKQQWARHLDREGTQLIGGLSAFIGGAGSLIGGHALLTAGAFVVTLGLLTGGFVGLGIGGAVLCRYACKKQKRAHQVYTNLQYAQHLKS